MHGLFVLHCSGVSRIGSELADEDCLVASIGCFVGTGVTGASAGCLVGIGVAIPYISFEKKEDKAVVAHVFREEHTNLI